MPKKPPEVYRKQATSQITVRLIRFLSHLSHWTFQVDRNHTESYGFSYGKSVGTGGTPSNSCTPKANTLQTEPMMKLRPKCMVFEAQKWQAKRRKKDNLDRKFVNDVNKNAA